MVAVISQVNLRTNVSKWVVDSDATDTYVQTEVFVPPILV